MALLNIGDTWNYCLDRANKDQSGMSFTPEQFNLAAKFVNYEFLKLKVGLPETYRPGMPFAPQAWQISQKITDDAQHLLIWMGGPDYPLLALDQYGIGTIPSDYVAFSSCYYSRVTNKVDEDGENITSMRPVEFVTDAQFAYRQKSVVKPPTKDFPIAKFVGGKIQFLPAGIRFLNFTYLKEPAEPIFGYDVDGNNDIVYDPTTSTQFNWPQVCLPDIAAMIYMRMTEQLQNPLQIQLAEQRKVGGL